jgi:hypothetical protein
MKWNSNKTVLWWAPFHNCVNGPCSPLSNMATS